MRINAAVASCAVLVVCACLAALGPVHASRSSQGATQQQTADAREIFAFQTRVKEYVALHRKLEDGLAQIGHDVDAAALRAHQKALAAAIQRARAAAQPGQLLTQDTRHALRRAISRGLGPAERSSILDPEDNPAGFTPKVNAVYPASLPISTMPPSVLLNLPPLPEEVEFRFVGRYLILRDTHADIIIDFMSDAIS